MDRIQDVYLCKGLGTLGAKYPGETLDLQGKFCGTILAFDSPRRDAILKKTKQQGLNIGSSGERAIMLIFEEKHTDLLLSVLESIIKR